ncbi:Uncharacterised protein [uncultured Roseburia sp.]|uniref:Derlin n=1 Tax=Brotonthovivens ammoniilytica TaxID=2981725 RepID=A0ABT2TPK9_9FIRM|nr:hypothetical protein [Brotonthovivens ammoniilytica]MCU6763636.1 derlin [Brotonthovivens ammoniilytica]SCJ28888.1 Uncharacterised protein [uncultured Roseburia sp.]
MNFLNKLERKVGRFAIPGLMKYVILCYVAGYIFQFINPQILGFLTLEPYMIFHYSQVWRLVSWVLIPPQTGIIFAIIMMFFYYQLGMNLERTWGAFRFNVYIFGGMIFTVIGALILYFVMGQNVLMGGLFSTYYINLSIFLAFAVCYPNMQVMLYFVIPIKMKWLALVYAALAAYSAVNSGWAGRVAIIASLLNFLIFFLSTRNYKAYSPHEYKRKRDFKRQVHQAKTNPRTGGVSKHKCAVCGRTEIDHPDLEFRFCSKCDGNYEYCQDHLFTHEHVKHK